MSPESLPRVAVIVFVTVLLGLFAVLFFQNDADARRHCEAKGYSEEVCAWR